MNKLAALLTFTLLAHLCKAQTFVKPTGATVGNQTVIAIPTGPAGTSMKQALAYFPDDYAKSTRKRPLLIFLHGAGQAGNLDITQLNGDGLPQLISQGLKPYGIDPATGDTIKWIVISPHCTDNSSCSYSYAQLVYTIPYLIQQYQVDPTCVWVGGLSAGGSATWSVPMGDTVLPKLIAGIIPESNGGWDVNINVTAFKNNLIKWAKEGGAGLYICGTQDPGYNYGFGVYNPLMKANCQPGRWYDSFPLNLAHVPLVWQQPWALSARVWSKTMNTWTQMWTLRRNAVAAPPPPKPAPIAAPGPSTAITLPLSSVNLNGTGSSDAGGKIVAYQWVKLCGANGDTIAVPSAAATAVTGLRAGRYIYQLTVTDDAGVTNTAQVFVDVLVPVFATKQTITTTWSDGHVTTTTQNLTQ